MDEDQRILHRELTDKIINAAIEVHKTLGPGLLESAYEACLVHELVTQGLNVSRQVDLPILYKGVKVDCGYRMDVIVEGVVLVEIKSVDSINPVFEAQLLTYLKLSGIRVGLLMNFNVRLLKDGLMRRIV